MLAVRLDPRLAPRIDPSDVLQESLIEASQKLDDYLRDRPLPFYVWLRQIAWEQLANEHARHIGALKRSVTREAPGDIVLSDTSLLELANRFLSRGPSPSEELRRKEVRRQVRAAIGRMRFNDREVLILRFLEQLSIKETAALLHISEKAVTVRQVRAAERLRKLLDDVAGWEEK
jgi:RNA polymerase sigma-70 factor (ECF subfamily)